jgi:hemolysin-activating ACP:hemolysin acyltransferase
VRDLFLEVGRFLCEAYHRNPDEWLLDRIMHCLFSGQYFIQRTDGKITTYAGWFLIDRDKLDDVINFNHVPDDVRAGNVIWVIDAASTDGGIRKAQQKLRDTYPRTGRVKGVAWLRNETYPVISLRQQGVCYEMVSG